MTTTANQLDQPFSCIVVTAIRLESGVIVTRNLSARGVKHRYKRFTEIESQNGQNFMGRVVLLKDERFIPKELNGIIN